VVASMSCSAAIPALLINASSRPHRSTVTSTTLAACTASARSAGRTMTSFASSTCAAISVSVSSSVRSFRPMSASRNPRATSRSAHARPMPEPAPVMIATGGIVIPHDRTGKGSSLVVGCWSTASRVVPDAVSSAIHSITIAVPILFLFATTTFVFFHFALQSLFACLSFGQNLRTLAVRDIRWVPRPRRWITLPVAQRKVRQYLRRQHLLQQLLLSAVQRFTLVTERFEFLTGASGFPQALPTSALGLDTYAE